MPWYVAEVDTIVVSMGKNSASSWHIVLRVEYVLPHQFTRYPDSFITYIGMCSPVNNFLITEAAAIRPVSYVLEVPAQGIDG